MRSTPFLLFSSLIVATTLTNADESTPPKPKESCNVCNKTFKDKRGLSSHMLHVHAETLKGKEDNKGKKSKTGRGKGIKKRGGGALWQGGARHLLKGLKGKDLKKLKDLVWPTL